MASSFRNIITVIASVAVILALFGILSLYGTPNGTPQTPVVKPDPSPSQPV